MDLLALWNRMSALPMGKRLFSKSLGVYIPYSGSIGAEVQILERGHARLELSDRRAVRNHLGSVHAIALANFSELCSGLAMIAGLPKSLRAILTAFEIQYLKKARGKLTAESWCDVPENLASAQDFKIVVEVCDESGQVVCRAQSTWRVAPAKK